MMISPAWVLFLGLTVASIARGDSNECPAMGPIDHLTLTLGPGDGTSRKVGEALCVSDSCTAIFVKMTWSKPTDFDCNGGDYAIAALVDNILREFKSSTSEPAYSAPINRSDLANHGGKRWVFQVQASGTNAGKQVFSAEKFIPNPIKAPTAFAASLSNGILKLNWAESEPRVIDINGGTAPIRGYIITQLRESDQAEIIVAEANNGTNWTAPSPGGSGKFLVRAHDDLGIGIASGVVDVGSDDKSSGGCTSGGGAHGNASGGWLLIAVFLLIGTALRTRFRAEPQRVRARR